MTQQLDDTTPDARSGSAAHLDPAPRQASAGTRVRNLECSETPETPARRPRPAEPSPRDCQGR